MPLTTDRCGPIKLAKALKFCFEQFSRQDKMTRVSVSTYVSCRSNFSDQDKRDHCKDPSSKPAFVTSDAEDEQDSPIADIVNIQSTEFLASSLATASFHPVSSVVPATSSPTPIAQMSVKEPMIPLGPTPHVLIVEDNPINVHIITLIICIAS
jgi:hypothetical protein